MPIRVIIEGQEVVEKTFQDMKVRLENISPVLGSIGLYMTRSIQRNFQQGGRPPWTPSRRAGLEGGRTLALSGVLKGSIASLVRGNDVYIGTNVLYGRIQQYGGIVRPTKAKALAIPLNKEARSLSQGKGAKSIRDIPGLFFLPSKKPGTVGVLARKKKEQIEPMFALKTEVKIPPRPFLVIQPEDAAWIEKQMAKHIEGK